MGDLILTVLAIGSALNTVLVARGPVMFLMDTGSDGYVAKLLSETGQSPNEVTEEARIELVGHAITLVFCGVVLWHVWAGGLS